MKKTVLYKTIDGHDVIIGFDRPTVNGEATSEIVNKAIKDTSEHQAAEAKKAEYAEAVRELSEIQKKYKKGVKVSSEDQGKWNTALGIMSVRQDELVPLARDLKDKRLALRREHAVYFEPRLGEVIKTAAEVDALARAVNARKPGTVIRLGNTKELIALVKAKKDDNDDAIKVATDAITIQDNRGRVYFRKSGGRWGRTHIVRLGDKVPADAVLDQDVTDTQRNEIERDRVSALPESEKAAERARAMQVALNMAAGMRSRLEIQSDAKALAKSKAAYEDEVARIEGLYG